MQILTYFERCQIQTRLELNYKPIHIAAQIKKCKSVISRELKRNSKPDGTYSADYAQKLAEGRNQKIHIKKLESNPILLSWVIESLKSGMSPEQISGRLEKQKTFVPVDVQEFSVSHECIYQYIYDPKNKSQKLWQYLRRKHKVRSPKSLRGGKKKKVLIPDRVSIHERPEIINERTRIGDWETDTVEGSGKTNLSVQRERKSQMIKIHKVPNKTAISTRDAIAETVEQFPKEVCLSFTFDNGSEGVLHTDIKDWYLVETYFCDPYKSWQKGGVENGNGLIREYFPKGTNFDDISDEEIQRVEDLLSNRPRKGLDFLTPHEYMTQELTKMGLCF